LRLNCKIHVHETYFLVLVTEGVSQVRRLRFFRIVLAHVYNVQHFHIGKNLLTDWALAPRKPRDFRFQCLDAGGLLGLLILVIQVLQRKLSVFDDFLNLDRNFEGKNGQSFLASLQDYVTAHFLTNGFATS
jgi:hypothetical protein